MTTIEQRAYWAGLFDGEGGIQLARNTSGRGREQAANLGLKICVTNAHQGCLEELQTAYGGNVNSRKKRNTRETWSTVYDWVLCGKKAATFLHDIAPYATIKKPQIEAVLTFAETLYAAWKEHHENGGSLRLTAEGLVLRRVAFRAFRQEIERLCGRGIAWGV